MISSLSTSSLTTKHQFEPAKYLLKPSAVLKTLNNQNTRNRSMIQNRLTQSVGNLTNFEDLPAVHNATKEIESVGTKNAGIGRKQLLAVKKAVNTRVMNAFKIKMNELNTLAPHCRAGKLEEIEALEQSLPPLRPDFHAEAGHIKDDLALVKAREQAALWLREAKERIQACKSGTTVCNRNPTFAEPAGRRFELTFESVSALVSHFRQNIGDAEVCTTLCEVARKWAEPYWSEPAAFDDKDADLLQERRELMSQRGVEVLATETIQRHRNHSLLKARATKHASRLLGALNSKLLVSTAWLALDSLPVCDATLQTMTHLVKDGQISELAASGARDLVREYSSRFPADRSMQLRLSSLAKSLAGSTVKDEKIERFAADWALQDVEVARALFASRDNGAGAVPVAELAELFRKMGLKVSDRELREQVAVIDVKRTGAIEWTEFLYMVEMWGGVRNWSIESQFDEAKLNNLRRLFDRFDADGTGYIQTRELQSVLAHFGVYVKSTQVTEMIADVDAVGSGKIDWYEFLYLMSKHCEKDNMAEMHRRAFAFFEGSDREKGKISCAEFKKQIAKLSDGAISKTDIDQVVQYVKTLANSKDERCLDYREFVLLMTS